MILLLRQGIFFFIEHLYKENHYKYRERGNRNKEITTIFTAKRDREIIVVLKCLMINKIIIKRIVKEEKIQYNRKYIKISSRSTVQCLVNCLHAGR